MLWCLQSHCLRDRMNLLSAITKLGHAFYFFPGVTLNVEAKSKFYYMIPRSKKANKNQFPILVRRNQPITSRNPRHGAKRNKGRDKNPFPLAVPPSIRLFGLSPESAGLMLRCIRLNNLSLPSSVHHTVKGQMAEG